MIIQLYYSELGKSKINEEVIFFFFNKNSWLICEL